MAAPEAITQFDRQYELKCHVITEGVRATEEYLKHQGPDVLDNPNYQAALAQLHAAQEAPGYLAYGESLD